jgi:hypothetical protein
MMRCDYVLASILFAKIMESVCARSVGGYLQNGTAHDFRKTEH